MKNASEYVVDDFDVNARPQTDADSPVTRSWGIPSDKSDSGFATDFKFTDDAQIIRFHPDSFPPLSYKEHWLASKTSGKRSYTCLNPRRKPGVSCPLCEMDPNIPGQFAKSKISLTIVNFSSDPFQRQLMTGGARLSEALHTMDSNKFGPLLGKYWSVSKSGERQNIAYHIAPIKDRDLKEDWGIDLDEANAFFDSTQAYPASVIKSYTHAELLEIISTLS